MSSELKVNVKFLSHQNGGRKVLPEDLLSSGMYRPHFVVIDKKNSEEYLGVAFISQSKKLIAEEEVIATAIKMYENVDYTELTIGTTFTIREGSAIIGYGTVISSGT
ncbi:hypothetical protein [Marinicellulosiphila megalodicopiae]|uniref:hypothetical protein n=1 Tax=Marinicellulosiphila megalodicopiae TaxID=2724896 RepID=UPI003BB2010C